METEQLKNIANRIVRKGYGCHGFVHECPNPIFAGETIYSDCLGRYVNGYSNGSLWIIGFTPLEETFLRKHIDLLFQAL